MTVSLLAEASTVITAATAEPPGEQHDRVAALFDRDEIADAEGTVRVDKNLLALRPRVGARGEGRRYYVGNERVGLTSSA